MITIATFTFSKITVAVMQAVKRRRSSDLLAETTGTIRCAEVAVSLLTMQQSMLVSFEGMAPQKQHILNLFTGAGVCILILGLGIHIILYIKERTRP